MKDALGHGSAAGVHAAGTQATPQLQRRHFEAIAAELLKQGPMRSKLGGDPEYEKAVAAHTQRVNDMADKLATTNPGFKRDRFVAAATGGGYRFKGPGANAAAVARKAAKFLRK
jgi:hypothetical protein